MSLVLLGDCEFEDLYTSAPVKNEWGIDNIIRKMNGARALLRDFLATLEQGQEHPDYPGYFLQTWAPDDNPNVCVVALAYKGLPNGATPPVDIQTEFTPATGSVSKSYVLENGGLGRAYRKQGIYKIELGQYASPGEAAEVAVTKDVYATGANMEFNFNAIQTVYRYVRLGEPSQPRYFTVRDPRIPVPTKIRYTTSDGQSYGGNAPNSITADLIPTVLTRVVGFTKKNIIGTPYWECQDVVRRELGEGDSDGEGSFGGG